jgi:hypothetical protein
MPTLRNLRLTLCFSCFFIIACEPKNNVERAPIEPGTHIEITLDGVLQPFDAPAISLCSERLPEGLMLTISSGGPACPEQFGMGGTGNPISLGRVCQELYLQLEQVEVGKTIPTEGTSQKLLLYQQYAEPKLFITSGNTSSASGVKGSILVDALEALPGGQYFMRFSLRLTNSHDVEARGWFTTTPKTCLRG